MGVSNFDIDNQIKRNLHYFKHQKDIIDAKNTRASMISLRNKWVQSQKIKNYQDEYDRLRSALATSSTAMKGKPTSEYVKEHEKELMPKLGEQMFNGVSNRLSYLEKEGAKSFYKII